VIWYRGYCIWSITGNYYPTQTGTVFSVNDLPALDGDTIKTVLFYLLYFLNWIIYGKYFTHEISFDIIVSKILGTKFNFCQHNCSIANSFLFWVITA
jgi:hypothetical protein